MAPPHDRYNYVDAVAPQGCCSAQSGPMKGGGSCRRDSRNLAGIFGWDQRQERTEGAFFVRCRDMTSTGKCASSRTVAYGKAGPDARGHTIGPQATLAAPRRSGSEGPITTPCTPYGAGASKHCGRPRTRLVDCIRSVLVAAAAGSAATRSSGAKSRGLKTPCFVSFEKRGGDRLVGPEMAGGFLLPWNCQYEVCSRTNVRVPMLQLRTSAGSWDGNPGCA